MLKNPPALFQKIQEGILKEGKRLMRLKFKVEGSYWAKNGIKQFDSDNQPTQALWKI